VPVLRIKALRLFYNFSVLFVSYSYSADHRIPQTHDDLERNVRTASLLTMPLRRPIQVCALIAGTLAALAIGNWAFGDWRSLAFGPDFVPMAPSTAWCVLLLSCGLLLHGQWPSNALARALAYLVAISLTIMGLTVSIQWIHGFGLPIEGWLTTAPDRIGDIPVGRMSPLTGTALLLAALALLLELPPLGRRGWCRQFASALSLTTLLISLVMVLSYAVGMPLLYDSHTIPMALWTAITFLPLGLGLLAAAGTETLPLSLFQIPPKTALRRPRGWIVGGPVLIFLLLVVGIGTVGYRFFRHNVAVSCESAKEGLTAIADLKVRNIVDWREERLSDSQAVMCDVFLGQQVRKFLGDAAPATVPPELLARLCSIREHNQGLRAVLVDPQMNVRLASPANKVHFGPIAQTLAKEALRSNRVAMSDLHPSRFTGEIHLDLAIPLNDRLDSPGAGAPPLGLIVIEVDPEKFLYPQIQNWPTPSPTGETLLIRREGDETLYLNELRHRKGTALSLRLPMNHTLNGPMNEFRKDSSQSASCAACHAARSVPRAAECDLKSIAMPTHVAAQAICDPEVVMEGVDYRNKPVLAAVRSIPGTPWFVVAKVDQDEIYAPMREQALTTGVLTLSFILLAALGVSLISRRRDAKEWEASDQIINSLPGVFYMFDEKRFVRWNENWETVTGYSAKEVGKMYGTDFFEGADRVHIMERMQEVFRTGESNAEAEIATKDGRRIPYYFTGLRVMFDGKPHLIGLGMDITEQTRTKKALLQFNEQLQSAAIQVKNLMTNVVTLNNFSARFDNPNLIPCWESKKCDNTACSSYRNHKNLRCWEVAGTFCGGKVQGKLAQKLGDCRLCVVYQSARNNPINDLGETFNTMIAVLHDRHEEIKEINEQLELTTSQAKQMTLEAESATRAKSEFLTNMSHEIRTPMTAILGYAEILTDSLKDPDYLEAANTIRRNGKHLLELINDILDLSKVEAGKMEIEPTRCSPYELLADVVSLMRVRADAKQLKLDIDMAGPLPETIFTDPLRLRQVLVNLVGNAIKFTDQGEVRITARLTTWGAAVRAACVGWGERSEPPYEPT